MKTIAVLNQEESAFFSHYDPDTVEFLTGLGKSNMNLTGDIYEKSKSLFYQRNNSCQLN